MLSLPLVKFWSWLRSKGMKQGDRLAMGTYLYRVHVNPRDPDGTSSARQRATAEGRIIVVGH